jgi:sec-independent protein translocase protein TatB
MFDFGWQEIMLVAFVLVLVVGPKDLPRALKTFTGYMGKIRGMANDFRSSLMEVADQEEFREVKKAIADTKSGLIEQTKEPLADIKKNIEDAGNTAEIKDAVGDIKNTASSIKAEAASVSTSDKTSPVKKTPVKKTQANKTPVKTSKAKTAPAKKASAKTATAKPKKTTSS